MGIEKLFKEINGKICISSKGVQTVLGIHRNTLRNYTNAGLEKVQTGWFELAAVINFMAEKKGAVANDEEESFAQMKLRYEAMLKKEQAEAATLKNEIERGEYIRRSDAVGDLQRFFCYSPTQPDGSKPENCDGGCTIRNTGASPAD
ncbi:hypothetical protein L5D93_00240 [Paenibacillus thiaminolyticus]|nr:hypothetical protein [Paenibacillus thiaminolyticus]